MVISAWGSSASKASESASASTRGGSGRSSARRTSSTQRATSSSTPPSSRSRLLVRARDQANVGLAAARTASSTVWRSRASSYGGDEQIGHDEVDVHRAPGTPGSRRRQDEPVSEEARPEVQEQRLPIADGQRRAASVVDLEVVDARDAAAEQPCHLLGAEAVASAMERRLVRAGRQAQHGRRPAAVAVERGRAAG